MSKCLVSNNDFFSFFPSPTQRSKGIEKIANISEDRMPLVKVKSILPKSKTQISSVFTKFSSIKPTNLNIFNQNSTNANVPSIKSVRTTEIGDSHELLGNMFRTANDRIPIKICKSWEALICHFKGQILCNIFFECWQKYKNVINEKILIVKVFSIFQTRYPQMCS